MKILHTGDWHVGKPIRGHSREDEHEAVLGEIVDLAHGHQVDLVLVAGDQFNSASPSPESERIVYRTLSALGQIAPTVVIPGNHDNARRLDAIRHLLEGSRVYAHPFIAPPDEGGIRLITTANGEAAQVACLPFLSQRYAITAADLMTKDAGDHTVKYAARCRAIIQALCAGFGSDTVNIVLAHTCCVGGALGGGERAAQTIFDYWIEPISFPPNAHYVALGHLHRSQKIGGACPIRYCGSPLQLDFGEALNDPVVLLVEVTSSTSADIKELPLMAGRRLRTLRGSLAQLATLEDDVGDDYLRVIVEEQARVGLSDQVRGVFPNAVRIILEPPEAPRKTERSSSAGKSPHELFIAYLEERGALDERVVALFDRLCEEADEAAAS